MENRAVKIYMEHISGQSFYPSDEFIGEYAFTNSDIISKSVAAILSLPNFSYDEYFLDCADEELKMGIIQETLRLNDKMHFATKQLKCGCDFGINIYVTFGEHEPKTHTSEMEELYSCDVCGKPTPKNKPICSEKCFNEIDVNILTQKRNKLNREIATLKKAILKN